MRIVTYNIDTPSTEADDIAYRMCDGESQTIAVEIFDHPSCETAATGETRGPWVIGHKPEVLKWLSDHGHTDYAIQITHGPWTGKEDDE